MKKIPFLLMIVMLMSACGASNNKKNVAKKDKVSVMLDWVPNTNHIGLYVAQALGYFDEAGLDVEIMQPPEDGALDFLLTGKTDVMIGWESTLFFSRDRGLPIVAVAAILQENDSVIVSLANSGIIRPRDLVGKRYLSYGSANDIATVQALMAKDGVVKPEVTLALSGSMADLNALMHGEGDYIWFFRGWDVLAARLQGIELNEILVRDFDEALNHYTPMYLTTDTNIKKDEEKLQRLMQAIARGYEYASKHPQEASDIFLQAVPAMDRALIEASTQHLASLYVNKDGKFGVMEAEVFARYLPWAIENGLLPEDGRNIVVEDIFTNRLLERD